MAEKPLDRMPPIEATSLETSGPMAFRPFRNAVRPGSSAFSLTPSRECRAPIIPVIGVTNCRPAGVSAARSAAYCFVAVDVFPAAAPAEA